TTQESSDSTRSVSMFRLPCGWQRHPHGFPNFHAGGGVTRMVFSISMRVAASPAWFPQLSCSWRRHPHRFLDFHAGGSVTRMDFPISMQVAVSPASKILPVNRGSNAPLRASRLRLLYDLAIHELSTPPFFIYTLLGKTSPGSKISNRSGRQTTPRGR